MKAIVMNLIKMQNLSDVNVSVPPIVRFYLIQIL